MKNLELIQENVYVSKETFEIILPDERTVKACFVIEVNDLERSCGEKGHCIYVNATLLPDRRTT